jgi:hypothetical protein
LYQIVTALGTVNGTDVVSSISTPELPTMVLAVPSRALLAATSLELAWKWACFAPWLVLTNEMEKQGDNPCLSCFKASRRNLRGVPSRAEGVFSFSPCILFRSQISQTTHHLPKAAILLLALTFLFLLLYFEPNG